MSWFKKNPKGTNGEVYQALREGLDKMKRLQIERIPLMVEEAGPSGESKKAVGWSPINRLNLGYYPYATLHEIEKEKIDENKHYIVASLFYRKGVGGEPDIERVEVVHRTRIFPLFPASGKHYYSVAYHYDGDSIKIFADDNQKIEGWKGAEVEEAINKGIREYLAITKELMEKAGVFKALEKIANRAVSPFDQILSDMRNSIEKAKKHPL
ncbi:MAG: hypothetical protein N3G22_00920 [Candidatus Micrarchaeota archaeon]|nr:hypothetical protein [Candidatus Micrarchaeota archaeon]